MQHSETIFIDEPLEEFREIITSVIEGVDKLINKTNFNFYFLTETKSEQCKNSLKKLLVIDEGMPEEEFESFVKKLIKETTSFSWGHNELEFIFIIFDQSDKHIVYDATALVGLLIHEINHGLQRQRGFEDDLQRSLLLTLEMFEKLALMIPNYSKDRMEELMLQIGQISLYVLKDIYVNREVIERAYASEVLAYYQALFGLNEKNKDLVSPNISIQITKDPINNGISVDEFQSAFLVLLTLIPTWLPFLNVGDKFEKKQALDIQKYVNNTYSQVKSLNRYFNYLVNIYFAYFSFTTRFHQKFFSAIFTIAIDYLNEGDFLLWQLGKMVEELELMLEIEDDSEFLVNHVLLSVLKASFIYAKQNKLDSNKVNSIEIKMKNYLDKEEISEWLEDWHEYEFENLLLFTLHQLIPNLRSKYVSHTRGIRRYTFLVLGINQILIDQPKSKFNQEYLYLKNQIISFIADRDSLYLSLNILYPLEFKISGLILEDNLSFTSEEAAEFLILFKFFQIPKTNFHLSLGSKLVHMVQFNIARAEKSNEPLDSEIIALTVFTVLADLSSNQLTYIVSLFRAVLMSINMPMTFIKKCLRIFGNLVADIKYKKEVNDSELVDESMSED